MGEESRPRPGGSISRLAPKARGQSRTPSRLFPGAAGNQFLTRYAPAGLKGQSRSTPLSESSARTLDRWAISPWRGHCGTWAIDLPDEAANRRSSRTSALPTNAIRPSTRHRLMMRRISIDSAVVAVKGDLSNQDAIRAAMEKADYASVRGPYRYSNDHFPIQNFYLQKVVKKPRRRLRDRHRDDDPQGSSGSLSRQMSDEVSEGLGGLRPQRRSVMRMAAAAML